MTGRSVGGHERAYEGNTNNWGTPLELVRALGSFDLDPCGRAGHPTAQVVWTEGQEDGLALPWNGRVWMNPPYGPHVGKWLDRLAAHGNGIALVFARVETKAYWQTVWERADGILFLKGRLRFLTEDGSPAKGNAGGPSSLVAYGKQNVEALAASGLVGVLIKDWDRLDGQESVPWL